jgi:hypothetical protein
MRRLAVAALVAVVGGLAAAGATFAGVAARQTSRSPSTTETTTTVPALARGAGTGVRR